MAESAEQLLPESSSNGVKQTMKDLFAGAMGGIAQVLIGQPFDIVKVRLQTTSNYSGALDCATKIWKTEGPLAFYKGTLTPLIGIGACVSVQFGGFHAARRYFEAQNAAKATTNASASSPSAVVAAAGPLSYSQYYLAGAFAGVTNSVLSGPIEHVRIRLQTQPHTANPADRLYSGPMSCIRTLVSKAGWANGLYRGQAVTILREAQAYGMWFLTYELLMSSDIQRRNLKGREEVETWRLALYGGTAGEMLWLSSYPLDVIKSKMQTDGLGVAKPAAAAAAPAKNPADAAAAKQFGTQRYKNMRDCFAQTWAQEGFRGFWKGIGPTLVRAMPVSAATFAVAEMTLRAIS